MLQSKRIKHLKVKTKQFACETHWEQGLLPETVMVEFNFRLKADHKKLKESFPNINTMRRYVNDNLSIEAISKMVRKIPLNDFKFDFATYNYERDIESVTRLYYNKHITNFMFGFYIVLCSKNETKSCSAEDVNRCINTLVEDFTPLYFENKKVEKYFSLSR